MIGEMNGGQLRVRTPHVIHETIDGEVIVIDLSSGTYYSLRGSAAEVWELIQVPEGVRAGSVVDVLASRFGVPLADVQTALELFLEDLRDEGLVVWEEAADDGTDPGSAVPGARLQPNGSGSFEAPRLEKFTDMQDLVLLDPVHEVGEVGWPATRPDAEAAA
jgi:hypothetical protein